MATAGNIPIANPSFEIDMITCIPGIPSCNTSDAITSWTGSELVNAAFGVYTPGTNSYPGGVPNGVNVAFLQELGNTESISQTLGSTLQANDTYTVSFYVGLRKDVNVIAPGLGCYGFNVTLLAGGHILNSLLQANSGANFCSLVTIGTFTKFSFTYSSGSNPVGLGSPLQIVLTAQGTGSIFEPAEIDFDQITITDNALVPQPYYFSDLAVGGGLQTTLTYINYSPQTITCVTNFYSDSGTPLAIPFQVREPFRRRTDVLQPGQFIHDQSVANLNFAQRRRSGRKPPAAARFRPACIYRLYQAGVAVGHRPA